MNLQFYHVWSTVFMFEQVPKSTTQISQRSFSNEVVRLLVFHLLIYLNVWLVAVMWPVQVSFIGTILESAPLNLLSESFFHSLALNELDMLADSVTFQFLLHCILWRSMLIASLYILWDNSLLADCFPTTFNLNCFQTDVNRHLAFLVIA